MTLEEFKILVALEPSWTISINGREFLHLASAEIDFEGDRIRFGRFSRRIAEVVWARPSVMRVRAHARLRSQIDIVMFYAGERIPSAAELLRRRRAFQRLLEPAVEKYFGQRVSGLILHSDKQRGIGGAYPRLLLGNTRAVIAVDPDEAVPVINGVVRAAIQWAGTIGRRLSVVIPYGRRQTIAARLAAMPSLRVIAEWLEWNGEDLRPLEWSAPEVETHVHPNIQPDVCTEVARILALSPDVLQAVPHIVGGAVSIRFRGLEIAHIKERETTYPLGEPLEVLIESLSRERRAGSRHPLARVHEESWLESNLIRQIRDLLPVRQDYVYPQVPSFVGEERKIIDLLAVTDWGRLVVIEIKASADPDLPFQALDYWLAVERHRKAGDFKTNGYFKEIDILDEPALLVIVAPLLSFHRTLNKLTAFFPADLQMMQIGLTQEWKMAIKILRRQGGLR